MSLFPSGTRPDATGEFGQVLPDVSINSIVHGYFKARDKSRYSKERSSDAGPNTTAIFGCTFQGV